MNSKGHNFEIKVVGNYPGSGIVIEYDDNIGWSHKHLQCTKCNLKLQTYDTFENIITCEEQIIKNIIE